MAVISSHHSSYQVAPFVSYDEYDAIGFFLDIRHGVLQELNERDTRLLNAIFSCATVKEAILSLSHQVDSEDLEKEVFSLLERLQSQMLLEPQGANSSHVAFQPTSVPSEKRETQKNIPSYSSVTWKQRLVGAAHIFFVFNELRQDEGLYKAYLYIQKLKHTKQFLSAEDAFERTRGEYWWYRLVTGLFERRVAHLLGQAPGEEGLCMVRAVAFCVYLLVLNVPAHIVIGRPTYGSRNGFKLHVWVEMQGKPLNERPNVRDAYRVMYDFPF